MPYLYDLLDAPKQAVGVSLGDLAARRPQGQVSRNPAGYYRMVEPGNINLEERPVVKNADGSISTVRSMSANFDGREVLIPTVSEDGRIMGDREAMDAYVKTGRHLGKFFTPEDATRYAEQLHLDQMRFYEGAK